MPSLRDRIDAGELVLCLALAQARTADIPMVAAASGFDAVYVDLEHTATSFETVSLLCTGAIAAGITPLVRVPSHDHDQLTRSLDVGAMGVIVPHVETARRGRADRRPAASHRGATARWRDRTRRTATAPPAAGAARRLRHADHRGGDARDTRRGRTRRRDRGGAGRRHGDAGTP